MAEFDYLGWRYAPEIDAYVHPDIDEPWREEMPPPFTLRPDPWDVQYITPPNSAGGSFEALMNDIATWNAWSNHYRDQQRYVDELYYQMASQRWQVSYLNIPSSTYTYNGQSPHDLRGPDLSWLNDPWAVHNLPWVYRLTNGAFERLFNIDQNRDGYIGDPDSDFDPGPPIPAPRPTEPEPDPDPNPAPEPAPPPRPRPPQTTPDGKPALARARPKPKNLPIATWQWMAYQWIGLEISRTRIEHENGWLADPEKAEGVMRMLATAAGITAWMAYSTPPAHGTVVSTIPASKITFTSPWVNVGMRALGALFPVLSLINRTTGRYELNQQALRQQGIPHITAMGLEMPLAEIETKEFDRKVMPVAINTPLGRITTTSKETASRRGNSRYGRITQTMTLDLTRAIPANPEASWTGTSSRPIRPYPAAPVLNIAALPGYIVLPDIPATTPDTPYTDEGKLEVTIPKPGTIAITRTLTRSKSATFRWDNRLQYDKKNAGMRGYLAINRAVSSSWGNVTEALDFIHAFLDNTQVNLYGQWWNFGHLSGTQKQKVLDMIRKGEAEYVTDWEGVGKSLLVNEISDRAIANMSKIESGIMGNAATNTFGSASTWLGRF